MTDNDVSFRQRAVTELLVKEEIPAADIHHRLQRVYRDVCMGASSVRRCVKHFKEGNTSIQVQPCSGRPRTASAEHNKKRVDEIIKKGRGVTLDVIATKLGIGHNAVQEMPGILGYRKICARRVPRLLTEDHKVQRKAITSEMLRRYRDEGFFAQYCDRRRKLVSPFRPWNEAAEYGMASFGFTNKNETKDNSIS